MKEIERIPAPSFNLFNHDGKAVKLEDFSGKWLVIYFYSRDNTSGCTKEAIDFTNHLDQFSELGATVIGISPDSQESHFKFIDKNNLKHTLLSDPDKKVLKAYGAWGEKKNYGKLYEGVIRSTFIIDPHGFLRSSFVNVKVDGHVEKVLKTLNEITAG